MELRSFFLLYGKTNKIFNFVATNAKICSLDALLNGNQCAIIVYKWDYHVERRGGVHNFQCYGTGMQIPAHLTTHSAKSRSVFPDITERVSASADQ